jgi:hypothetical protein
MTAPANKIPLSVNYTGRDYYALRSQLIERVKERTNNNWQGNDPSDFGVALIESFAYMGDLINYYIDRIANESYILTATQRESLINLANMYGYNPSNYISSIVDLRFTSTNGYFGGIGAAIIESGTIDGTLYTNLAKIIVPNDNTFSIGDVIRVVGVPTTATGSISGESVIYNTSVYNGQFVIDYIGYNNIGRNVLWYQPKATIADITLDGTSFTVTSSGSLNPVAGQKVEIKNVTVSGSTKNYNGKWEVESTTEAIDESTPATFTINSANNVADITRVLGDGTTVTFSAWNDFIVGQTINVRDIKSADNTGGTAGSGYNFTEATVSDVKDTQAVVTSAVYSGTGTGKIVTFTTNKQFVANDIVNITGIRSLLNPTGNNNEGFNFTDALVVTPSAVTATITGVAAGGPGTAVYTTSSAHGFKKNEFVTIAGVTSTLNGDETSAYNIESAKILAITTDTFTVESYFADEYVSGGVASLYKFTVSAVLTTSPSVTTRPDDSSPSSGSVVCRQFKVLNSQNTAVTSLVNAAATALVGGTYSTGGTVYYTELPAIGGGGASIGQVREYGFDLIPQGTQVSAQVVDGGVTKTVPFITQSDSVVFYRSTSTDPVFAIQGEDISLRTDNLADISSIPHDIDGERIGFSAGTPGQMFTLKEKEVDPTTVEIYIDNGSEFEQWRLVENIRDFASGDKVFSVTISSVNQVVVNFGDGISGAIPTSESMIKARYIAGGGSIGNVGARTITTIGSIPGYTPAEQAALRAKITVSNSSAAAGGADPETNDSIRYNTPRAIRSLNRAVTLEDFANLALTVPGVSKANATATNRSNVTVYVAPTQSDSSDLFPGLIGNITTTTERTTQLDYLLTTAVPDFLNDKKSIGTTVTYAQPSYSDINIAVTFAILPQYSPAVVEANIKTAITSDFSFSEVGFADVITPEEVEFKLRQVTGVRNVRVTQLSRRGGSGRNSLVGTPDEIFVFQESGITLSRASSVSALAGITIVAKDTSGSIVTPVTFSKNFNSSVYNYIVNVPSDTASLTITPVSSDTLAAITVNNVATASSGNVVVTSFDDPIVVTVTATDGVTVTSYAFNITGIA